MAGHSHSANIKHRKDRQNEKLSKFRLQFRKKIEFLIQEEGGISEKIFSIAGENNFPKEKIYQIWDKIQQKNKENSFFQGFYQAPFGILLYLETEKNFADDLVNDFNLKKIPFSSLSSYFRLFYALNFDLESNINVEDYLLNLLPNDVWEEVDYNEKEKMLFSNNHELIKRIKEIIEKDENGLLIKEEKSFWKPLISQYLTDEEKIEYYSRLEKELVDKKYYTNIEK